MIKPIRATGLERLELQRLRDGVGRLYAALQEATEAENPLASGAWAPPVDLCETEELILIRVELPGVSADQIKIGICNTKLRIWGEKKRRPNRRRIISYQSNEKLAVIGYHMPFPALGYVEKVGTSYRWLPASSQFHI
jgi:HSP20 family molecular chaperone IbpA